MPGIKFRIAGDVSRNLLDNDSLNAIKELENYENVQFSGYLKRSALSSFLSKAIVLLNTSHYEGFSLTYLDSFAVGTPIVTIKNNDPDDFIAQNNLGAVCDDFSDLDNALLKIINHSDYYTLAKRCQKYVKENHSFERLSEQIIESLEKL